MSSQESYPLRALAPRRREGALAKDFRGIFLKRGANPPYAAAKTP